MNLIKRIAAILKPVIKAPRAKLLIFSIISTELFTIGLIVGFNKFRALFMNSFQQHDFHGFVLALTLFCTLAFFYIISTGYNVFFMQGLGFVLREAIYIRLSAHIQSNHLLFKESKVIEQRLTQDLEEFTSLSIKLASGMINSLVKLPIFIYIMLQSAPFWMIGVAFGWVFLGNFIASRIAKPLIKLNYEQETREGMLRRKILAWYGTAKEAPSLRLVKLNWKSLMTRAKRLGFFQSGFMQISVVIPHIVLARSYFMGTLTLGVLWATADAFKTILESLEYFIEKRDEISKLDSVTKRVEEII